MWRCCRIRNCHTKTERCNSVDFRQGGGKREGEEFTVEVKANVSFTSEVSEEDRDWLRLVTQTRALSTSVLKFAASENMSDEKREGAITFKSGDLLETVTVYQAGSIPTIVLNETNYKIPAEGRI